MPPHSCIGWAVISQVERRIFACKVVWSTLSGEKRGCPVTKKRFSPMPWPGTEKERGARGMQTPVTPEQRQAAKREIVRRVTQGMEESPTEREDTRQHPPE